MYNFIINLFTEEDYNYLLGEGGSDSNKNAKLLLVFPDSESSPVVIERDEIEEQIEENPILSSYPRKKLLEFFNLNRFVNPTHNNANNIGSNSALLSHSPTHYKLTNSYIEKNQQYPNGNAIIKIPLSKVEAFENSVKETIYYNYFSELCDHVASFLKDFDVINPQNVFGLKENDYIVFLVDKTDINEYLELIEDYTLNKILKYVTFEGVCDSCGETGFLYMLTNGNMFDLGKGRKFLLRHPTRFKTNLTSKSPENFNVCGRCAKQVYNFFEYIKKNRFYRYVFPTTVTIDTSDYKDYSTKPIGILKMLKILYNRNRFQEFDYVMMVTDPKIENIEFRYVNNFNYNLQNENPAVNIRDIPIYSTLRELTSKGKEGEITIIQNGRNKTTFLMELNLIFNNALAPSLFETDPNKLMKSLHPFIKLKIIQYNSIIRNFIYFQDISFFEDRIYTKLFREILSEIITNSNLREGIEFISSRKIL